MATLISRPNSKVSGTIATASGQGQAWVASSGGDAVNGYPLIDDALTQPADASADADALFSSSEATGALEFGMQDVAIPAGDFVSAVAVWLSVATTAGQAHDQLRAELLGLLPAPPTLNLAGLGTGVPQWASAAVTGLREGDVTQAELNAMTLRLTNLAAGNLTNIRVAYAEITTARVTRVRTVI